MNKIRRRKLAEINEQLEVLKACIEEIMEEEQDAFDNLPESFQDSERGEIMTEKIDNMENAISSLEEVIGYIEESQE